MAKGKSRRPEPPEICPVCGAEVHRNALACRECGADYNSGWRDGAHTYDGTGLPDEEFDYDDFVKREFGRETKPAGIKTIWWVTGIVILVITIVAWLLEVARG